MCAFLELSEAACIHGEIVIMVILITMCFFCVIWTVDYFWLQLFCQLNFALLFS
jgi:hypothetical protein